MISWNTEMSLFIINWYNGIISWIENKNKICHEKKVFKNFILFDESLKYLKFNIEKQLKYWTPYKIFSLYKLFISWLDHEKVEATVKFWIEIRSSLYILKRQNVTA